MTTESTELTPEPTHCYRRGGQGDPGRLTGGERTCTLGGCRGVRLGVRWPDGKMTWPCSDGLFIREDGQWQLY